MMDIIINFLGGVLTIMFLLVCILLFAVFGLGVIITLALWFKNIIDDIKGKSESENKE
jgi:hypothetical protein